MTKSLEELLDLSPQEPDPEKQDKSSAKVTHEDIVAEAVTAINAISISEKVDSALALVTGLDEHDREMDEISRKALETYENMLELGLNIPDVHAGKIYEVAGSMLKTAMDAREAKVSKKLKVLDLQLKKLRLDKMENTKDPSGEDASGPEFDRNELLAHLINARKPDDNDK